MALYLVQHGKSLPREVDPERGLSEEGVAEVRRIAQVAAGYGVKVGQIRHSGKKRALQTAEIFERILLSKAGSMPAPGLNPMDPVEPVGSALSAKENVMLVGHLPFMEKLAAYLITGLPEKIIFKFQNGGIVCLDQNVDTNAWHIKWALMPNIG